MVRARVLGIAAAAGLAACSHVTQPMPVGGSKADGVVMLAFETSSRDSRDVDWRAADASAAQRCAAWRYSRAERFGAERRQCRAVGVVDCNLWAVAVDYQCVT